MPNVSLSFHFVTFFGCQRPAFFCLFAYAITWRKFPEDAKQFYHQSPTNALFAALLKTILITCFADKVLLTGR